MKALLSPITMLLDCQQRLWLHLDFSWLSMQPDRPTHSLSRLWRYGRWYWKASVHHCSITSTAWDQQLCVTIRCKSAVVARIQRLVLLKEYQFPFIRFVVLIFKVCGNIKDLETIDILTFGDTSKNVNRVAQGARAVPVAIFVHLLYRRPALGRYIVALHVSLGSAPCTTSHQDDFVLPVTQNRFHSCQ